MPFTKVVPHFCLRAAFVLGWAGDFREVSKSRIGGLGGGDTNLEIVFRRVAFMRAQLIVCVICGLSFQIYPVVDFDEQIVGNRSADTLRTFGHIVLRFSPHPTCAALSQLSLVLARSLVDPCIVDNPADNGKL